MGWAEFAIIRSRQRMHSYCVIRADSAFSNYSWIIFESPDRSTVLLFRVNVLLGFITEFDDPISLSFHPFAIILRFGIGTRVKILCVCICSFYSLDSYFQDWYLIGGFKVNRANGRRVKFLVKFERKSRVKVGEEGGSFIWKKKNWSVKFNYWIWNSVWKTLYSLKRGGEKGNKDKIRDKIF